MEKKFNITPENIKEYMRNYSHDFPLTIDDKAGLDYQDDETKAIPHNSHIPGKKTKSRIVKLEITSFIGVSWNAIHYYGKLIADGIEFKCLTDNYTTSNWEAAEKNPLYQWTYEFELMRPVTQEEIDADPDRWEGYYVENNSFTPSFEGKEEIIALGIECFKQRFSGEWELWVDDLTTCRQSIYQIEL